MPVTYIGSSVLAKIFMVTKPENAIFITRVGSVLAKIFMVTKRSLHSFPSLSGSVLAKIFMVTKPKPDKSP